MQREYLITPVAKPRQSRRDKWLNPPRECVGQYRRFANTCRLQKVELPFCGAHVTFILPMPDSWSDKKKKNMDGYRHIQKPDLDNLIKALGDAIYSDDSKIWDLHATKRWGRTGKIIIEVNE